MRRREWWGGGETEGDMGHTPTPGTTSDGSPSPEQATQSMGTAWRRRGVSHRPVAEVQGNVASLGCTGPPTSQHKCGEVATQVSILCRLQAQCQDYHWLLFRVTGIRHACLTFKSLPSGPTADGWWLHDNCPIPVPGSSAYTTCLSSLGAGLGRLDLNVVQP